MIVCNAIGEVEYREQGMEALKDERCPSCFIVFPRRPPKSMTNFCGNSGCGWNPNRTVRLNQIPLVARLSSLVRERL